ncbi:hypothetical protein EML15_04905 [Corynebacterium sp. sy017]|nr:hypothetical protein [Corynebacterium sp. sy017]TSD92091.1 hypothetical protein ELY17_04905 [Corynebacterium sp. SY003]
MLLSEDSRAINSTWCYIGRTENFVNRLSEHHKIKHSGNVL